MVICKQETCEKQAIYGKKCRYPIYCMEHKDNSMRMVVNPKCKEIECYTQATFGYPNTNKRIACSIHKTPEMTTLNKRHIYLCKKEGCNIQASYGIIGSTKKLYCVKHKQDEMVLLGTKICKEPNCNTQPFFGYDKPLYCKLHAKMI